MQENHPRPKKAPNMLSIFGLDKQRSPKTMPVKGSGPSLSYVFLTKIYAKRKWQNWQQVFFTGTKDREQKVKSQHPGLARLDGHNISVFVWENKLSRVHKALGATRSTSLVIKYIEHHTSTSRSRCHHCQSTGSKKSMGGKEETGNGEKQLAGIVSLLAVRASSRQCSFLFVHEMCKDMRY